MMSNPIDAIRFLRQVIDKLAEHDVALLQDDYDDRRHEWEWLEEALQSIVRNNAEALEVGLRATELASQYDEGMISWHLEAPPAMWCVGASNSLNAKRTGRILKPTLLEALRALDAPDCEV